MAYTKEMREAKAAAAQAGPPKDETAPPDCPETQLEGKHRPAYQDDPSISTPPVINPGKQPSPFQMSDDEVATLSAAQNNASIRRSLDGVEQAVRDAQASAEAKIREAPETKALVADPGNLSKWDAFVKAFGPSNNKPPRPKENPLGPLDPALWEWMVQYEPQEFINSYGKRKGDEVKIMLAQARKNLGK